MDHLLTIIFIALYAYTLVSTISVLLLENRNPTKSLSWVLVLLFLPIIGLIFYLIFGQNLRKQKIISKRASVILPIDSNIRSTSAKLTKTSLTIIN